MQTADLWAGLDTPGLHGQAAILRDEDRHFSGTDVLEMAAGIGRQLSASVGSGRYLIGSSAPMETLVRILGCWSQGLVPVLVREGLPQSAVERLADLVGAADGFLGDEDVRFSADRRDPHPDEALVLTTSGTTGQPKAVALPASSPYLNASTIASDLQLTGDDVLLVAQPLSHVYGLVGNALTGMFAGASCIVVPSDRRGPQLHSLIREEGVTVIQGAPSFWRVLLAMWRGKAFDLVRLWTTASEAPGSALVQRISEALPNATGVAGYGMTEAGPRISHIRATSPDFHDGGIGTPFPHLRWRLDEEDAGRGRLALAGPSMMLGYIGRDGDLTGYDADGFFVSSDIVEAGETGLRYVGRADHRIKIADHLVSPEELEITLMRFPGVTGARALPVEHRLAGTVLEAEVTVDSDRFDATAAIGFVRDHLDPSLIPRRLHVVDRIERTAGGKIDRGTRRP